MIKEFVVILYFLLGCSTANAQSVISSLNSGAYSTPDLMYTVGEIYVNPVGSADDSNSGLMGILYQVEFNVTGMEDHLYTEDLSAFPNPTNHSIIFTGRSQNQISRFYIFDNNGKSVAEFNNYNGKVDLSEFPDGIYFIKTNIEEISAFKIIKQ